MNSRQRCTTGTPVSMTLLMAMTSAFLQGSQAFGASTLTTRSTGQTDHFYKQSQTSSDSRLFRLKLSAMDDLFADDSTVSQRKPNNPRRSILALCLGTACSSLVTTPSSNNHPPSALALVKGNSPPPPKSATSSSIKCTNVEECQAAAELKEQQERQQDEANQIPAKITKNGTRYRDIPNTESVSSSSAQSPSSSTNIGVQVGDQVTVYYKVLKLGKRSYDGLSGEGTVIFSRGYGYEDDEPQPRTKSWTTNVGGEASTRSSSNIDALNDGLLGMTVGTVRRIVVLPDRGWRKPGQQCDGGPGGLGAGGDLKTDYVVVPTATMVATEACLDASKQPYPNSFGQQRRMAQRFDQSLIMEVELVQIVPKRG